MDQDREEIQGMINRESRQVGLAVACAVLLIAAFFEWSPPSPLSWFVSIFFGALVYFTYSAIMFRTNILKPYLETRATIDPDVFRSWDLQALGSVHAFGSRQILDEFRNEVLSSFGSSIDVDGMIGHLAEQWQAGAQPRFSREGLANFVPARIYNGSDERISFQEFMQEKGFVKPNPNGGWGWTDHGRSQIEIMFEAIPPPPPPETARNGPVTGSSPA